MKPNQLTLSEVQRWADEIEAKIDRLNASAVDFRQRRIVNAGKSIGPFDYVTRTELDEAMQKPQSQVINIGPSTILNPGQSFRAGPFATRGSPVGHINEAFLATDLSYVGWVSDGAVWKYLSGLHSDVLANRPTTLGFDDLGFRFFATDMITEYVWHGSFWVTLGGVYQTLTNANLGTTIAYIVQHLINSPDVGEVGTGVGIGMEIPNDVPETVQAATVHVEWTDASDGTEDSDVIIKIRVNGTLAEAFRVLHTGAIQAAGDVIFKSTGNFTATLTHANTGNRTYTLTDESGNVVYQTAQLTTNQIALGANNGARVKELGSLGTTVQVLHGNAAGAPTWGAVDLTADVTGDLPVSAGGTGAGTASGARSNLNAAEQQTVGGDGPGAYSTITGITVTSEGTISAISGT